MRNLVLLVSFSLSISVAAPTWAGHYDVSYSGGVATNSSGGIYPYGQNSGVYGGSASASGNGVSADASGQITATFTWNESYAGEPRPLSAIIHETASAGYQGYYVTSHNIADGLGDAPAESYNNGTSSG